MKKENKHMVATSRQIQIASQPPPGPDVNLIISKRQQHEAKAMRKQSERTHLNPKTDPTCDKKGVHMHPKPAQIGPKTTPMDASRIQDAPS